MAQDTGEDLLRAWLELAATVTSRQMVTGLTYNEAVVSNLLLHQQKEMQQKPMTATELCRITRIQKSQMNQLLNDLEKRGYLVRSRSQQDRRRVYLRLTPEGETAYDKSHQFSKRLMDAVIAHIGSQNAKQLSEQLRIINAVLQENLKGENQANEH